MPPFGCTWNGLVGIRLATQFVARGAPSKNGCAQSKEAEQLNSRNVCHERERSSLNVQDSTVCPPIEAAVSAASALCASDPTLDQDEITAATSDRGPVHRGPLVTIARF